MEKKMENKMDTREYMGVILLDEFPKVITT